MLPETAAKPSAAKPSAAPVAFARQFRPLALFTAVLVVCFAKTLWGLARLTLHSELYSHIPLIPLVSAYLAWSERRALPPVSAPRRGLGALLLAGGLLSVLGSMLVRHSASTLEDIDWLAWNTFSLLLLFLAGCCLCLGRSALRALAFPLGFLLFMVPLPSIAENGFVSFLQHRSADAAELLFGLVGTPLLRQGVEFQLPGFNLQVAPECSGIHSTLVLIITSVLAARLFLRSPLNRAVLVLAVVPLGILRNAVRIVTIGELCVHVSPDMINSSLHHHGGPLFFLVTLVPFFGLLYALRKLELRKPFHGT